MNIGPEAQRALEILVLYNKKSLSSHLLEYQELLDALIYCNEAVAESGQKFPDWWTYSDTIVAKFVMHSNALYNIGLRTCINSNYFKEFSDSKYIDVPSLKIILRAQLESFLMFHYICVNPTAYLEKEFRFDTWMYTSLLERSLIESDSAVAAKRRQDDLLALQNLRDSIENSVYFAQLSRSQQNTFLRKGHARLYKSWKSIMDETEFVKNGIMTMFYSLISNYAHTEGLSVLQMKQLNFAYDDKNEQANLNIFLSKQLICGLIISLTKLYDVVKMRFNTLPDRDKLAINIYAGMSKK